MANFLPVWSGSQVKNKTIKNIHMKKTILAVSFLVSGFLFSCNNGNNTANDMAGDTTFNQNPTMVERDSAILSDDSATVKTAVGSNDEERNAIIQENKEAQKLKTDELKQKEKQ